MSKIADFLYGENRKKSHKQLTIYDMEEICEQDDFSEFSGELISNAYRDIDFLKSKFRGKAKSELVDYLKNYVFPEGMRLIDKNVKQGDFGEILATAVINEFEENIVACGNKFYWKFNNQKSLFCTDIFAHNSDGEVTDLVFYEVKTYTTANKNLGILAHDSLLRDQQSGLNHIADFLSRFHFMEGKTIENTGNIALANESYLKAEKFNDMVSNSSNYSKHFEIVLIRDRNKFHADEIEKLNNLPPKFINLFVTIILIDDLSSLISKSFEHAYELIWKKINDT